MTEGNQLSSYLDFYSNIVKLFYKETDRAAAILASSYLETLLETFLRTRMIHDKTTDDLFTGNGALSTFSSRIAICYSMSFIPKTAYNDLNLIRRIRNHFAHNMADASFNDPAIKDRCNQFSFNTSDKQEPRIKFLIAVGMLTVVIINQKPTDFVKNDK